MNNAFLIYVFCQFFIEQVPIYQLTTRLHQLVHPHQHQRKGQKEKVSSYLDFWHIICDESALHHVLFLIALKSLYL